jgi:putative ABC transport system substrate-binding protein
LTPIGDPTDSEAGRSQSRLGGGAVVNRRAAFVVLLLAGGCDRKDAPRDAASADVSARAPTSGRGLAGAQGRIPRVAVLVFGPRSAQGAGATAGQPPVLLMRERLKELGHVEGKTIVLEEHYADGDPERLEQAAQAVVAGKPDVIVAIAAAATLAARRATSTIPIVMVHAGDPVGAGLAVTLSQPGGNVTGTTSMVPDLGAKQLEILRQVLPRLRSVGVLLNATNPGHRLQLALMSEAAAPLGVRLAVAEVVRSDDVDAALARLHKVRPDALFVMIEPMIFQNRAKVLEFVRANKLPSSFDVGRQLVREGGLLSFGPVLSTHHGLAVEYVDKILKGAKPADLPFEQPTNYRLFVNVKTAKALGLVVPQSLLQRADGVIE